MLGPFRVCFSLLFLWPWFACADVQASEKPRLFYAGFAFAGNANEIQTNYPIASLLDETGVPGGKFFNKQTRDVLLANRAAFSHVDLSLDLIKPGDTPLVLALALTSERMLTETLGDISKLVLQLGFELLVIDFRDMTIASSVPISIELIDAKQAPHSRDEAAQLMRSMVSGPHSQLFSALLDKAQLVTIRGANRATLQISGVSLGEKVTPFLPEAFKQRPAMYSRAVAQLMGSLLTSKAQVALLPYAKDSLNSKMACRFSDGQSLQFTIPKPTFVVDVNLKGFKKVLSQKTDAESLWIYGAFLDIKVVEPDTGMLFMEAPLKYAVSKVVPASQSSVAEFPVVSEALRGALVEAVEAMQSNKRTKERVLELCKL
jgi:hypothetical protein